MTREEEIKDEADIYAEKHGFRVPYDGSNDFYDKTDVKASLEGFITGAKWANKTMIDRVCEFIAEWFYEHPHTTKMICSDEFENIDELLDRLEKAMKGGEE